jgi:hypothetical protein
MLRADLEEMLGCAVLSRLLAGYLIGSGRTLVRPEGEGDVRDWISSRRHTAVAPRIYSG